MQLEKGKVVATRLDACLKQATLLVFECCPTQSDCANKTIYIQASQYFLEFADASHRKSQQHPYAEKKIAVNRRFCLFDKMGSLDKAKMYPTQSWRKMRLQEFWHTHYIVQTITKIND